MTNVSSFFSELLATAILLMGVMALTDKKNASPPAGILPIGLFLLVLGIGAALGMETARIYINSFYHSLTKCG